MRFEFLEHFTDFKCRFTDPRPGKVLVGIEAND